MDRMSCQFFFVCGSHENTKLVGFEMFRWVDGERRPPQVWKITKGVTWNKFDESLFHLLNIYSVRICQSSWYAKYM